MDVFFDIIGSANFWAAAIRIATPLIFGVEIVSILIRPFTLGVRLLAIMFADEKIFQI